MRSVISFAPFSESQSRTPPTEHRSRPLNLKTGKQGHFMAKSRTAQEGLGQNQGGLAKMRTA